uniref:Accessory protein p15 n=1 Tax=Hedgehog chapparvovirus TaxID=3072828 RepID=A0AA51N5Z4_9VIRU|nr:accessory protein p15 [Hedgehog chapparvovirus]
MTQRWDGPTGFTLLLTVHAGTKETLAECRELILDAICLISHRWNMEFELKEEKGTFHAWAKNTRFTVGDLTIQKALGDLFDNGLITFQRGPPDSTFESAIRYLQCKRKWNVPDVVSVISDDTGGAHQPLWFKPKRK